MTEYQTSPLLQAALSHYKAKRDKCLAELDIYLNRPVGVGEHPGIVNEVVKLFSELENSDSVISTIETIIQGNQQSPLNKLVNQITKENSNDIENKQ